MHFVRYPVYFVRHGQSVWNVERLTQGQTAHPPLSELGWQQAAEAADLIQQDLESQGLRAGQVLSSDLVRAAQTAEVIGKALGVMLTTDARLREQHLGWLEGKPYEETWAVAADLDWTDPELPIAGGESMMDVTRRMAEVVQELSPDAVAVVVSHGDAIRAVITHLNGHSPVTGPWVEVANGSVVRYDGDFTWLGKR
jgi:probable phosphoglycerate mutase